MGITGETQRMVWMSLPRKRKWGRPARRNPDSLSEAGRGEHVHVAGLEFVLPG